MRPEARPEPLAVDFRGAASEKVKEYATEKLSRLERYAPRPILHAKVEFHEEGNKAIPTPFSVKASVDVNGHVLHASDAGITYEAAIDLAADRLRRQMERVHDSHDSRPSHRGDKPAAAPGMAAALPGDEPAA